MKIQYLGTAAAEGWPGIFCNCESCKEARRLGGKNIRTRSQAVVDDRLLIDFPPDTYAHMLDYGLNMPAIRTLIVTHSHQDHWYPEELMLRRKGFAVDIAGTLDIYGNDAVGRSLEQFLKEVSETASNRPQVAFHELKEFCSYSADGYTVTPLKAAHNPLENCFIYIIEKDGKRLLYGNDTGEFPEETWEFMKGIRLDLASLDCTMQRLQMKTGHMGLANDVNVADRLRRIGCADENTKFILTHFSHNGGWLHEEMERQAAKYGFCVAYDGMTAEV